MSATYLEEMKGYPNGLVSTMLRRRLESLRLLCFYAFIGHKNRDEDIRLIEARAIESMNRELARHRRTLRILALQPDTRKQHHLRVSIAVGESRGKVYVSLYPRSKRNPEEL